MKEREPRSTQMHHVLPHLVQNGDHGDVRLTRTGGSADEHVLAGIDRLTSLFLKLVQGKLKKVRAFDIHGGSLLSRGEMASCGHGG